MDDLTRCHSGQHFYDLGHERPQLGDPVGPRVHHDNRHAAYRDVLLEHQVAIHCDQVSESSTSHRPEEIAVAAPQPALISDRGHIKPWQVASEPLRHTLIKQHPHSGRRHPLQQKILGDVERGHGLLAADAREVGEELVEGVAGLKVLQ